jgi:tetratricopeptide (TPR) repeat protein
MDLLIKARRFDEALARAESQIERSQLTPGLRIQAATVLLTAAKAMPDEQARPVYERAIEVLQPALEASSQLLPVVVVIGHRTLGFCHEALGQSQRALGAYHNALQVEPDDPTILAARGLLLAKSGLPGAVPDFERAVAHGTTLIAPYIHLAHDSLIRGDYRRCLELCHRILSMTARPRILAATLQWVAFAQFELGSPQEQIRRSFLAALALDPLNEKIRENLRQFEQLAQSTSAADEEGTRWPAVEALDPTLAPPVDPSSPVVPLAA